MSGQTDNQAKEQEILAKEYEIQAVLSLLQEKRLLEYSKIKRENFQTSSGNNEETEEEIDFGQNGGIEEENEENQGNNGLGEVENGENEEKLEQMDDGDDSGEDLGNSGYGGVVEEIEGEKKVREFWHKRIKAFRSLVMSAQPKSSGRSLGKAPDFFVSLFQDIKNKISKQMFFQILKHFKLSEEEYLWDEKSRKGKARKEILQILKDISISDERKEEIINLLAESTSEISKDTIKLCIDTIFGNYISAKNELSIRARSAMGTLIRESNLIEKIFKYVTKVQDSNICEAPSEPEMPPNEQTETMTTPSGSNQAETDSTAATAERTDEQEVETSFNIELFQRLIVLFILLEIDSESSGKPEFKEKPNFNSLYPSVKNPNNLASNNPDLKNFRFQFQGAKSIIYLPLQKELDLTILELAVSYNEYKNFSGDQNNSIYHFKCHLFSRIQGRFGPKNALHILQLIKISNIYDQLKFYETRLRNRDSFSTLLTFTEDKSTPESTKENRLKWTFHQNYYINNLLCDKQVRFLHFCAFGQDLRTLKEEIEDSFIVMFIDKVQKEGGRQLLFQTSLMIAWIIFLF